MNRVITYLRYFFYLASNWNLRLACYMLWHEVKGERKYDIHTSGADELGHMEHAGIDITHATVYMPVSYPLLEAAFTFTDAGNCTHLLDIGSGKGRALCVAAYLGTRKVTGIDFSGLLCKSATANLARTKQKFPDLTYKIINNDAFYYEIPTDVDCIFLFNPFDAVIMSGVVENIAKSLHTAPRKISVIYANPMHKEIFTGAGFKETYHFQKMKYLELSVLETC